MSKVFLRRLGLAAIACLLMLATVLTATPQINATNASTVTPAPFVYNGIAYYPGQEIVGMRTENSKAFLLLNGNIRLDVYQAPIHYQDDYDIPGGPWHDIDLTFVDGKITQAPYELTIDGTQINVLNKRTGGFVAIRLLDIGGVGIAGATPVITGNRATWTDIATDTDVVVVAESGYIRFSRALKSDKAPLGAVFYIGQASGGIPINATARVDNPRSDIRVISSLVGHNLTETIDLSRSKNVTYPITIDPTLDIKVGASANDVGVVKYGGNWTRDALNFATLYIGYYDSNNVRYGCGLRFLNVTVPQGYAIVASYITLTAKANVSADDAKCKIVGNYTDNATTFSTLADYQARRGTDAGGANNNLRTTAEVAWTMPDFVTDSTYNTPDISSVVKEIVDRAGWVSGNAMVLWVDDHADQSTHTNGTYRAVYSYDGSSTKCASLHIEYIPAIPTATSTGATLVEETTATLGGSTTAINDSAITTRGFVWDTSSHGDPGDVAPAASGYALNWTENGSWGLGAFSHDITTLSEGTLYYYRAVVKNDKNHYGYGAESTFLTKPNPPTGFTAVGVSQTQIDLSWAMGAGSDNTCIVGKLGSSPGSRADGTWLWNGAGVATSHNGLAMGQHWYYDAYASRTVGALTQLSDPPDAEADATTVTLPTMSLGECQGFGKYWGVVGGTMVDDGTNPCGLVGFDYGETTAYGSSWTKTGTFADGYDFVTTLQNLNPGTLYHYRTKGFSTGWGYGPDAVFCTSGSPTLYEYLNSSDNADGTQIYGANWSAMQFTAQNTSHTTLYVMLKLKRTGNPGTVTVSLNYADGSHFPTGSDIVSATLDGDNFSSTAFTWYGFTWAVEENMAGTQAYAIAVRAPGGDAANYIEWRWVDGGVLANAVACHSTDAGVSWLTNSPDDYLFEIWGNPAIQVVGAAVFQGYLEDDDLLFTLLYNNTYAPYYPDTLVQNTFLVRLLDTDGVTVKAQTVCRAWGRKPGSIYLSASQAAGYTLGSAYYLNLYGNFTGYPTASYQLQSTDWHGSDLVQLDMWVLTTAADLGSYYSTDYITTLTTTEVLNTAGGTIFAIGIPSLDEVRPGLFAVAPSHPQYESTIGTTIFSTSVNWEDMVGTDVAGILNTTGGWFGILGKDMGAYGILSLYVLVAAFATIGRKRDVETGVGKGDFALLFGLALPFVLVGAYLRLIDIIYVAVPLSGLVIMFVYSMWWSRPT